MFPDLCWECPAEAAGVGHVQAVISFSSQLSKASGCEQDLPVSKFSDQEVVQPVVSHQKLFFLWLWAPGSCGMVQCPPLTVPHSCATLPLTDWAGGEVLSMEK